MTVYAIAELTIVDPDAYGRYLDKFFDVFSQYDGALLAADNSPDIIEGSWPHDKLVLISFPDRAAFDAWATSPEYEEIAQDRKAGARSTVIVAEGVLNPLELRRGK
ncbi:DUF1330 domain-containing protein [Nocardioides humi]|uniref:DUF1330 domain-containing protein n=1 Tax=Nocardioides humi TaxID=449461 RepID=A0ABN2AI65_9ACTN|nr:DUF1330 domain-containing protein [Nocardioides humi]